MNAISSEVSIDGCQGNYLFQKCDMSYKVMKQFDVYSYHRAYFTIILVDKRKLFAGHYFYQDYSYL
jgi:hypothetical protein